MRRSALFALVALNFGLAAAFGWLWLTPSGQLRNSQWEAPSPQRADYRAMMPPVSDSLPVDTSQFVALLERPLFTTTRRPPPPPPPPEPVAPVLVDNLSTAQLVGVFQSEGGGGIIIRIAGADRRLRLNQSVDGWTLQSISERSVTFTGQGQTRTLTLQRAALTAHTGLPPATAVAPVAAPAAGSQASPEATDQAGSTGGATPSQPDPRRAVFGGSRR